MRIGEVGESLGRGPYPEAPCPGRTFDTCSGAPGLVLLAILNVSLKYNMYLLGLSKALRQDGEPVLVFHQKTLLLFPYF